MFPKSKFPSGSSTKMFMPLCTTSQSPQVGRFSDIRGILQIVKLITQSSLSFLTSSVYSVHVSSGFILHGCGNGG
jgi:hypothetical protein